MHGIAELLKSSPEVEYNIEGDPRPDLLELVLKVRPTQCTLVPVKPGEMTSQAGWPAGHGRWTSSRRSSAASRKSGFA